MKLKSASATLLIAIVFVAVACDSGGAPTAAAQPTAAASAPTIAVSAPATASASVPTSAPAATATKAAATSAPTAASARTSAPAPTKAASSGPALPEVILAAQRAQLKAKTFRVTSTIVSSTGTLTTTTEAVTPDRVHVTLGSASEVIAIRGVGAWMKRAGTWTAVPAGLADTYLSVLDPKSIEDLGLTIVFDQVKLIGPDIINGKPMLVYQYATLVKGVTSDGRDLKGTAKLWVGVTDGLPYRAESEQDSALKAGEKTRTTQVWDYDPNIKIEKPI